jgi:hypothetical protein
MRKKCVETSKRGGLVKRGRGRGFDWIAAANILRYGIYMRLSGLLVAIALIISSMLGGGWSLVCGSSAVDSCCCATVVISAPASIDTCCGDSLPMPNEATSHACGCSIQVPAQKTETPALASGVSREEGAGQFFMSGTPLVAMVLTGKAPVLAPVGFAAPSRPARILYCSFLC